MSHCLNPVCPNPSHAQNQTATTCHSCGFQLLIQGRYRAIQPIGQGGFGRTFVAIDEQDPDHPQYVIKQSIPDQLNQRDRAEELFHQEALRLAELGQHSQIPQLISHCQQENYQYLVQEFVEGQTLAQILRDRGQFSTQAIEHILHSLLPVLDFIHTHDVIHRDIKPDNIIRRADGQLVLVDFGAAKHATGTALLKTGTTIGSAEYIAPEQTRGKATYASDIYSLGVTCVHLLTQMSPFDLIDGDNQWVWQDWSHQKISPELRHCLNKMIAPAPMQRFQSATAVREFLANPQLPAASPSPQLPATKRFFLPKWIRRSPIVRKPLTSTAVVAFSVGAIAAGIALSRSTAEAIRAKEAEGKTNIAFIGRGQQETILRNGKFRLRLPQETENYNYKVLKQLDTPEGLPAVLSVATSKKGDLKSYLAITWVSPNLVAKGAKIVSAAPDIVIQTIICESQRPTLQPPGDPTFKQYEDERSQPRSYTSYFEQGKMDAVCPTGYVHVASNKPYPHRSIP